jgi:hypothetical protein
MKYDAASPHGSELGERRVATARLAKRFSVQFRHLIRTDNMRARIVGSDSARFTLRKPQCRGRRRFTVERRFVDLR